MDNDTLDKMIEGLKTKAELEAYASAQHHTIVDLTRKLSLSDQKVKELEKLLEQTVPVIASPPQEVKSSLLDSDEEAICKMQLRKLHDKSTKSELTLEETKRVEIYTKLLQSLRSKKKADDGDAQAISTEELLKMVADEAKS